MAVKTIYDQDKMVHIFQTTILITFSSRKMFVFLIQVSKGTIHNRSQLVPVIS